MKKKVLVIGGIAAATVLVGGWALAQSAITVPAALGPRSCKGTALAAWVPA